MRLNDPAWDGKVKANLTAILEATNDLVGMADSSGKLFYLNRAGRKMLGFAEDEELDAVTLADCHASSAREMLACEAIPAALRGGAWSGQATLFSRASRVIPTQQTILAHQDARRPSGMSFACRLRISPERLHARRKNTRNFKKEFRTMLDFVPALIWCKDKDNRILRVNRPAAEAMGKTVQEIEGKSTAELYPDEAEKYHRDDLEVIQSEQPKRGIIEQVVTRTGEKVWVQTDKVPYRNEHDEVGGVIVFSIDITQRHEAQEEVRKLNEELEQRVNERTAELELANRQLQAENAERRRAEEALAQRAAELDEANKKLIEAERIKSEFFANVSHELRTPLTLTLAPLESLLAGECGPLAGTQSGVLTTVHNNVVRLLQMVTGLLDFSRFEAGKFEPHPEAVEIVSLTETIVADFSADKCAKQLTCRFDTDASQKRWPRWTGDLWRTHCVQLAFQRDQVHPEGGQSVGCAPYARGSASSRSDRQRHRHRRNRLAAFVSEVSP